MDLLLAPFLDPASRTFWGWALVFGVLAAGWKGRAAYDAVVRPLFHRSSALDVQLLIGRQLLRALGLLPTTAATVGLAVAVAQGVHTLGLPQLEVPPVLVTLVFSVVLFVAWDLSRFVLHRWMHTVPMLWAIHQVHHSAEVLTPLTFHRVHPFESVLYTGRSILVTGVLTGLFHAVFGGATQWTLFGVAGLGVVLNALFGNLRHSHLHLGFGPLERWFVSPAQHQLHHARGVEPCNYGTWLALWDRLAGSHRRSAEPVQAFGLEQPNHTHDLLSAWFAPPASWLPRVPPGGGRLSGSPVERESRSGAAFLRAELDRSPPAP